MKFRIARTLPVQVEMRISLEYDGYQLLHEYLSGWKAYEAPLDASKIFGVKDPNEENKKHGLPPNYFVIKHGEKPIDWVYKNFKNVVVHKDTVGDIIFEGDFIGYETGENKLEQRVS